MKAVEELQLRDIEHCSECHCAAGDDWDYKDYSNREIIVCPQCGSEIEQTAPSQVRKDEVMK